MLIEWPLFMRVLLPADWLRIRTQREGSTVKVEDILLICDQPITLLQLHSLYAGACITNNGFTSYSKGVSFSRLIQCFIFKKQKPHHPVRYRCMYRLAWCQLHQHPSSCQLITIAVFDSSYRNKKAKQTVYTMCQCRVITTDKWSFRRNVRVFL